MPIDFLELELRLLLLKHGRRRVLQSFATIEETSLEALEKQIRESVQSKPLRKPKVAVSAEESVENLGLEGKRRDQVLALAREFDRGRFLPQLRDAIRFCTQSGTKPRAKSRRELLPKVSSMLATMPDAKLDGLLSEIREGGDGTSFARLADALIRGT